MKIIMSHLLRSFFRISFRSYLSSSSSNSDPRNLNLLTEQDNQTHEVIPKHNLFNEEVQFEEINQNMDDWNIPEIPQDTLYVPKIIKDKHSFDYVIKMVENNITLGQHWVLLHEFPCFPCICILLLQRNTSNETHTLL